MPIPPYELASQLRKIDFNVNHVLLSSFNSSLNPVYKVKTKEGYYAAKIYQDHPYGYYKLDRNQLNQMLQVIDCLSSSMNSVSKPYQTFFDFDLGPLILWKWFQAFEEPIGDNVLDYTEPSMFINLGETLANIHNLLKNIDLTTPDKLYFQSLPDKLTTISEMRQNDWEFFQNISSSSFVKLKSLIQKWVSNLENYDLERIERGWTHRDFALRNIRFDTDNGTVKHIIDWDHVRPDLLISDIFGSLRGIYRESEIAASKFIEGYLSQKSLMNLDKEILEYIIHGERLCRSLFVICGGVWYDDIDKFNENLVGLDLEVYNLLKGYL